MEITQRPEPDQPDPEQPDPEQKTSLFTEMRTHEDWWAIWCGAIVLVIAFCSVWWNLPDDFSAKVAADEPIKVTSGLKSWLSRPGGWTDNPVDAFYKPGSDSSPATSRLPGILGAFLLLAVIFAFATAIRGLSVAAFLGAFPWVFLIATTAYVMAEQSIINAYNLEYVLWALVIGLLISNTVGTPKFLQPAVQTEFYIKSGLVIMGAEVLLNRLLALGVPGIFVAWVVTPIVLVSTFIFGQRVLKIPSRSLNMVISADMSVCGVSAAIATGAACKAKKEELSLAIGLSLTFTVIMMAVMPAVIKAFGLSPVLGGAWIGGTIDSTGAVAAAGAALGQQGLEVAATVKMIQNILIGVVAFFVAVYWVTRVEASPTGHKPSAMEIWYRFPKFVLGFVLVSLICTAYYESSTEASYVVDAAIGDVTKSLRGWLFCCAFVSIGLETRFREYAPYLRGGKPLMLYLCGQGLNIVMTLLMAWLMFEVLFRDWLSNAG